MCLSKFSPARSFCEAEIRVPGKLPVRLLASALLPTRLWPTNGASRTKNRQTYREISHRETSLRNSTKGNRAKLSGGVGWAYLPLRTSDWLQPCLFTFETRRFPRAGTWETSTNKKHRCGREVLSDENIDFTGSIVSIASCLQSLLIEGQLVTK